MSQTFTLCIATDTIVDDAQRIGVTADELSRIHIQVTAKIVPQPTLHLQLTYYIDVPTPSLAAKLDWPTWQTKQVGFSDYLWEETCLECFIKGSSVTDEADYSKNAAAYVEINASPDGRYALYQFDSYRNPSTLPPAPLYHIDKQERVGIHWANESLQCPSTDNSLFTKSSLASTLTRYERCFGILLNPLPKQQYAFNNTIIECIHPCVILKFNETALYFAPRHASPPDFHNAHHWSKFEG